MTELELRNEGAPERRTWITTRLRTAGFLAIIDIARELRVSTMTVRRDLHALQISGEVRLVHGGAILGPDDPHRRAFPNDGNAAAREWVARRAAAMIGGCDTIALDAGPTAHALAMALSDEFRGSVITHSLPVLQLLDHQTVKARTVALGGELLPDRHAFVGPTTEAAVSELRARTFFFSPAAMDARGTYARSPAEASVQRRLIAIADEVVLVATHDVLTGSAPACVAPLKELTCLVTDRPVPRAVAAALHRADVAVHVAGEARTSHGS